MQSVLAVECFSLDREHSIKEENLERFCND